ncbi:DUF4168 domain-containing protein [Altererythrobacter xixiisoli]|uniref:DUF4168 domain-containing protein n=1 Tax=Croceibacterium xixiisoli TaxID=1476466 RepID=A0A6I4TRL5_9SPHN|nr:DUF4168 domain-containing protein [Croceibacterium xixiisoli]MXO97781.1 DUF4168 domain-containing protein [Croceibacterium xixiisoli]
MKKVAFLIASGLMFSAASVSAQDAAPPPADTATDAAAPADTATDAAADTATDAAAPATAAPADPAAATFTEDQIQSYASALVKIQEVSGDATLDDAGKQAKMVAIVNEVGLDPQTFNAIGQATQTNPDIQSKVQAAVSTAQSTQPS